MRQYDTPPTEILLPTRRDGAGRDQARHASPLHSPDQRGERADEVPRRTYYGRPMIKRPTWSWYIPFYFFLGGIASGVSFIGAIAHLAGGPRHRGTVRNARYLAVVLAAICPIPLVVDLGRPQRFHHMLRVFKISSPLSVGTWMLSGFGLLSGLQAARQAAEDEVILKHKSPLGRLATLPPSGPITVLHGLFGMGLGGYTGTLLAVTAVPLWAAAGVLLGPLFLATAVASGAAALTLLGILSRRDDETVRANLETAESAATVVQLSLVTARDLLVPNYIDRPLRRSRWGLLYRAGAVGGGMVAPLALRVGMRLGGRRAGAGIAAAAATLTLLGALAERFAIVEAGKVSADDPLAYQELTRGYRGEARPTAEEQARKAPKMPRTRAGVSARDTAERRQQ